MNKLVIGSIKGSLNLITGCGSGLGRSTLEWFLKNGVGPTLAIDQNFPQDFQASLNLTKEQESRLIIRQHNTFDDEIEASISEFSKSFGPFDNVINVAGVALAFAFYWNKSKHIYELEHAQNLINFNTYGTFNVIRLASKYMIDESVKEKKPFMRKPRCIINTSCISTTHPSFGQSFYAASKAALDSMTLCIAREMSPFNIRCNTINVGYFDTKLLRCSEEVVRDLLCQVPLTPKRLGTGEEFAHLAQTIIENQMINGACIKIDAGARDVVQ